MVFVREHGYVILKVNVNRIACVARAVVYDVQLCAAVFGAAGQNDAPAGRIRGNVYYLPFAGGLGLAVYMAYGVFNAVRKSFLHS